MAYCPIQDMGRADLACEWMFNVLGTRAQVSADQKAGLIVDAGGAELVRASNPDPAGSALLMNKWAANPRQAFVLNQYKLINLLPYAGMTDGITTNWRIRVGARDRDTSFTVAYNMSRALKADAKVKNLNFALHWDQGHAGNYDVLSAFTWIDQRLAAGN